MDYRVHGVTKSRTWLSDFFTFRQWRGCASLLGTVQGARLWARQWRGHPTYNGDSAGGGGASPPLHPTSPQGQTACHQPFPTEE